VRMSSSASARKTSGMVEAIQDDGAIATPSRARSSSWVERSFGRNAPPSRRRQHQRMRTR
jgi:hypothetical protein